MYFVPSLVETGPLVLENSIFFNFVNVVLLIRYYLPLKRGVVLYLNTFEFLVYQTVIFAKFGWNWPSGTWLCQFFFFTISLLSPLWTGRVLLIPLLFTQRCFVFKFDRASVKLWKVHRQTDDRRTESQPRVICQLHQELTFHRYNFY